MVIAVIADIIGSRRLSDRASAQQALDETIAELEERHPGAEQPLSPTVGDELQGVYRDLGVCLNALLRVQLALPEGIGLRFGIGIGGIRPIASTHRELSDGPGWYAARAAIERVHQRQQRAVPHMRTWIVGAPGQDEVMESTIAASNAYLLVRDELVGAMSERVRRLTYGRLIGRSQHELAADEGVSQPSVSKALRTAGAAAILEGVAAIRGADA